MYVYVQVVPASGRASGAGDIRESFTATTPEGEEGSKMKDLISIIANNEVDIDNLDKGSSLLHDAVQVDR